MARDLMWVKAGTPFYKDKASLEVSGIFQEDTFGWVNPDDIDVLTGFSSRYLFSYPINQCPYNMEYVEENDLMYGQHEKITSKNALKELSILEARIKEQNKRRSNYG